MLEIKSTIKENDGVRGSTFNISKLEISFILNNYRLINQTINTVISFVESPIDHIGGNKIV